MVGSVCVCCCLFVWLRVRTCVVSVCDCLSACPFVCVCVLCVFAVVLCDCVCVFACVWLMLCV